MVNPVQLEEAYTQFINNLSDYTPDGIIHVDLKLLDEMGLLSQDQMESQEDDEQFPHYFHVIETSDKVTLFNHQFAVWIAPQVIDEEPCTLTLIALFEDETPNLELVFSTSGVYNTPKFVLKILRHFLAEVIDTESVISSIDNLKP